MDNVPLGALLGLLAALILLSAFFSGSETALMSINRYRLRHLARAGHRGAILVNKLLERPDRLIGLIMIGNNAVNIAASMLTAMIALRVIPELGVVYAGLLLTVVIVIFAEVTPKTLAALRPEILAYPAAFIYTPLLKFAYIFVVGINAVANALLRLVGVTIDNATETSLSREELHTVVKEAGAMIPKKHRSMLLNILELEEASIEDIMVPRNEVAGIDLNDSWDEIIEQLNHTNHTRLPVYRESIDHIIGMLHVKRIMRLMVDEENFNKDTLEQALIPAYFIPEGTTLMKQLLNFQKQKRRLALVVDEYGDLQGLVTLEDILEEIIGEFTTDAVTNTKDVYPQADGSYLIDGGVHIRDINKVLQWNLPTDGPKTLNGMILEHMEMIPEPGTSLLLHDLPVEVIKTRKNAVKMVRIFPGKHRRQQQQAHKETA